MHIPDALALTNQQVNALEAKWATDLSQALAASGARISLDITIRIQPQRDQARLAVLDAAIELRLARDAEMGLHGVLDTMLACERLNAGA